KVGDRGTEVGAHEAVRTVAADDEARPDLVVPAPGDGDAEHRRVFGGVETDDLVSPFTSTVGTERARSSRRRSSSGCAHMFASGPPAPAAPLLSTRSGAPPAASRHS